MIPHFDIRAIEIVTGTSVGVPSSLPEVPRHDTFSAATLPQSLDLAGTARGPSEAKRPWIGLAVECFDNVAKFGKELTQWGEYLTMSVAIAVASGIAIPGYLAAGNVIMPLATGFLATGAAMMLGGLALRAGGYCAARLLAKIK